MKEREGEREERRLGGTGKEGERNGREGERKEREGRIVIQPAEQSPLSPRARQSESGLD